MTATVVDEGVGTRLIRWVGLPAGGALALWLLKPAAEWLVTLRWVPFKGPLELIDGENRTTTFPREQVSAVFREKNTLVLLGRDTAELAREPHDLSVAPLAEAFRGKQYWRPAE